MMLTFYGKAWPIGYGVEKAVKPHDADFPYGRQAEYPGLARGILWSYYVSI